MICQPLLIITVLFYQIRNKISNSFNVYFASIGDKLASEIKTPTNKNINFTSYLKNPTQNRLKFTHITEEDTIKAIDNLENKNSSGHDVFRTNS